MIMVERWKDVLSLSRDDSCCEKWKDELSLFILFIDDWRKSERTYFHPSHESLLGFPLLYLQQVIVHHGKLGRKIFWNKSKSVSVIFHLLGKKSWEGRNVNGGLPARRGRVRVIGLEPAFVFVFVFVFIVIVIVDWRNLLVVNISIECCKLCLSLALVRDDRGSS